MQQAAIKTATTPIDLELYKIRTIDLSGNPNCAFIRFESIEEAKKSSKMLFETFFSCVVIDVQVVKIEEVMQELEENFKDLTIE